MTILNMIKKIYGKILRCRFNDPRCAGRSCRCGKGFFSGSERSTGVTTAADPYKDVREPLVRYLGDNLGKVDTYQKDMVAPLSAPESKSLDFLSSYSDQPRSTTFHVGKDQIEKTLSGNYDPTTSPYYQAVKAEAANNLKEQNEFIKDQAAGGGRYWTGARLEQQADAAADTTRGLNTVMGGLAEKERSNQLATLPMALEFLRSEEEDPLRKAGALQTYGALPREIEQAILGSNYDEWIRSNFTQPGNVAQIAGGVQQAPVYAEQGYEPSMFSKVFSPLATAAATAAGGPLGGAAADMILKKVFKPSGSGVGAGVGLKP